MANYIIMLSACCHVMLFTAHIAICFGTNSADECKPTPFQSDSLVHETSSPDEPFINEHTVTGDSLVHETCTSRSEIINQTTVTVHVPVPVPVPVVCNLDELFMTLTKYQDDTNQQMSHLNASFNSLLSSITAQDEHETKSANLKIEQLNEEVGALKEQKRNTQAYRDYQAEHTREELSECKKESKEWKQDNGKLLDAMSNHAVSSLKETNGQLEHNLGECSVEFGSAEQKLELCQARTTKLKRDLKMEKENYEICQSTSKDCKVKERELREKFKECTTQLRKGEVVMEALTQELNQVQYYLWFVMVLLALLMVCLAGSMAWFIKTAYQINIAQTNKIYKEQAGQQVASKGVCPSQQNGIAGHCTDKS